MTSLIKKFYAYSLTWKLLLVPVVATLSFAAYLVYSSLVLSDGDAVLKELRDIDYPILDEAEKNLNAYGQDRRCARSGGGNRRGGFSGYRSGQVI